MLLQSVYLVVLGSVSTDRKDFQVIDIDWLKVRWLEKSFDPHEVGLREGDIS